MRTTISIDDALLAEAKRIAVGRRCSLSELLSEALREFVTARKSPGPSQAVRLLTFKGQGIQPGVDLDHNASLVDLMER
jgi:hypothetical protein